ncbi:conserved Plasmodium protein, unknown function [Plasmodium sp. gorilla clade G2]|uniref:conserved Plasmodium protein, unknown function n=1 Tax=Plasmodium sp. gorilla clade G2 TaxID=880535 RepID=UPI000D225A6E|nr:conserved Plasmodium protein, unknown function [Plasmodium sp. gorilla clade G2]SOV17622.1 conserved Plasmodium protein, unknown function [Plasmodium sp. gorilla clade G2]
MANTWRCDGCLVENSDDALECVCCMQKRSIINDEKNGDVNINGNTNNDGLLINIDSNKKNEDETVAENKINEDKENTSRIDIIGGGGFIPSIKATNNTNNKSRSIFLNNVSNSNETETTTMTNDDNNLHINSKKNNFSDKEQKESKHSLDSSNKNVSLKSKKKKKYDKNDKGISKRVQPTRKCTKKKINYKT